jgi:hypothetical protein
MKRTAEASDAADRRLRQDNEFGPKSAAATLQLAEIAVRSGGAACERFSELRYSICGRFSRRVRQALARHLGE